MAEYGHPKIDIGAPQVNLSYAIDEKDGTPLFYELYPGSIVDNSQCKFMVDKAKDYGYKSIGLILDRGYFSAKNIRYFDDNGYAFVLMLKENYACVKESIQQVQGQLKEFKHNYYIPKYEVYGMTVEGKLYKTDKRTRYFHVFYDNERAARAQNSIMKSYTVMEEKLQKWLDKKTTRKETLKAFEKYYYLRFDSNGYFLSYKRKEKVIKKAMDETGYFVMCTAIKMTASEAIEVYRSRDESEKLFRIMKTELDYDKLAVYTDDSVKSKTHLVFLATIVRNAIYRGLQPVKEKTGNKKDYTVNAAIHSIENIEATKNTHGEYMREYALTKVQKNILGAFGLEEKDVDKAVRRINKQAIG